jgi:acetoin utilization protein AcuB
MFIANFMTAPAKTTRPDALLSEVRELMTTGNFRHLPVVDGEGRLVGIVTDRDLRSALPDGILNETDKELYLQRFAQTTVRTIMTEAVTSLTAEATLDDALLFFDRTRVGALPVVDGERRVVGILSVRDLLTAYRQLFGLGVKGSTLIGVVDQGDPTTLTRLTGALEAGHIPFTRLIRTGELGGHGSVIYIRVHTHNLNGVNKTLAAAGFKTVAPGLERSQDHA